MKQLSKQLLLFAAMFFCVLISFAQERQISGTVKDDNGNPLPNVSYLIKGTKIGGITDANGHFSIRANSNSTLVFSSVGFTTKEIKVENKNNLAVSLSAGGGELNEVVVTALGIKREKRALGYATTTIKGDDLIRAGNVQNPLTALYGQAAGMGIEVSSSGPTGGVKINIRGNASLSADANTRPLIVVDGIPIYDANSSMSPRGYDPLNSFDYGTGINDINAEDIESIEILKGAKATVLYGSLAGNGVMMITTKKGRQTRGFGVNVSLESDFDHPISYIHFQNEYGSGSTIYDTIYGTNPLGQKVRTFNNSSFQFGPAFDNSPIMNYDSTMTTYHAYPNNFTDIFKNSTSTVATVAVSGASERGNMRLAYTNKDYNGYFPNFFQKSNILSFNGQITPSKLMTLQIVGNLYDEKTQNRIPNIGRLTIDGINRDVNLPYWKGFYKDDLGQQRDLDPYGLPKVLNYGIESYMQFLWHQNENRYTDDKLHFIGSAKLDLNFTNWLSLTFNAGADYTDWDYNTEAKVTRLYPTIQGGSYKYSREKYQIQNYSAYLNFSKKFIHDNLDIFAFAGPAYYQNDYTQLGVGTYGGLQFANWYALGAGVTQNGDFGLVQSNNRSTEALASILGNASFGWKNTYYLEISARKDWTSTLAPGTNSYFYPGASLSYNFSNNIRVPELTYGKLRFSIADVGRGAPVAYWAYPSYSLGLVPGTGATTIGTPGSLFQEGIKPERKREYEIGFDTRWFQQHPLEVNFSFYQAHQYNQIMALGLTSTTGWNNIKINAGQVNNWGYEVFVKYTPFKNKNQRFDVSFNTANQFSKVVKLYPGITSYTITGSNSYQIVANEGKQIGEVQAWDYLRDKAGDKIVNAQGVYQADKTHLIDVGNINPYLLGGFFMDYYYKSFSVHVGMNYKFGGEYLSTTNYGLLLNGNTTETLKYRDEAHGGIPYYINNSSVAVQVPKGTTTAPADSKDGHIYHDGVIQPGVMDDGTGNYVKNTTIISATSYYGQYSGLYGNWFQPDKLYKNDYIKVREISFMYTVPQKIVNNLKLQKLTLSVFGRNLFYLYKTLPNIDAESSLGSNSFEELSALPQTRTLGVKLDASF